MITDVRSAISPSPADPAAAADAAADGLPTSAAQSAIFLLVIVVLLRSDLSIELSLTRNKETKSRTEDDDDVVILLCCLCRGC